MGAFTKEMKTMDSAWTNAPESSDLPEGQYTLTIQAAEIRKAKSSGKLRATFQYVVSEGEHLGASQFDGFTLDPENPVGMSMLKNLLGKRLGYEIPESMGDVEDILADITKKHPIVSAQIVKKGDFTNVRVLELLSAESEDATEDAAEEAEAADAPLEEETESEAAAFAVGDAVTFETDGETQNGKITKANDDGSFDVETDSENWSEVPADLLTLVEESADEEAEEEEEVDETLPELIALGNAHGLDIADDADRETAEETIKATKWKRDELTKEEIAVLEAIGVKPVAKATAKPAAKPAPKPAAKPTSKPAAKPAGKVIPKKGGKK